MGGRTPPFDMGHIIRNHYVTSHVLEKGGFSANAVKKLYFMHNNNLNRDISL